MDLNNNFGDNGGKRGKKAQNKGPEMEKVYHPRQMKGLSIDPSHSPFFLNNDKGGPKDSDSIFEDEDRYKLVKIMDSSRSNSRVGSPSPNNQLPQLHRVATDSSLSSSRFDSSSRFHSNNQFGSDAQLMSNAQSPPMSAPPRGDSLASRQQSSFPPATHFLPSSQDLDSSMQYSSHDIVSPPSQPEPVKLKDNGLTVPKTNEDRDSYFDKNAARMRNSNNYLNSFFDEKAEKYPSEKSETEIVVDSTASTVVDTRNNSLKTSDSYVQTSGPAPVLPPLTIDSGAKEPLCFGKKPAHTSVAKPVADHDGADEPVIHPRVKSFEASMHFAPSFISEQSNLTDILHTPRDSSVAGQPPIPVLPSGLSRVQSPAASAPMVNGSQPDYLGISNAYGNGDTDDNNRLSVLMRPLPPDDVQENPEERANRIRSFYKEYFDDNHRPMQPTEPLPKPSPQAHNEYPDLYNAHNNYSSQPQAHKGYPRQQQAHNEYYEDYTSEFLNEGTIYDSHQNGFVVAAAPFAEPITRRAMTPPPRAPPRFQQHGAPPRTGRSRATSNAHSNSSHMFPPRGASAMSQQYPPPPRGTSAMSHRNRHQQFKKALPPPKTLSSLPTPHLLKDDAAIFGAADFAPPVSFRERQNGRRPDSPLGVQRPYSPSVKAFVPLNSSFENLAHVPSP